MLDACGSVNHNIIHAGNPTRSHSVTEFYFIFIWNSICFRQHTTHHQEPKTTLASSGFACMEGHLMCSFRLLMIGSVLPETCWVSYKYEIKLLHCGNLLDFLYEFKCFFNFLKVNHAVSLLQSDTKNFTISNIYGITAVTLRIQQGLHIVLISSLKCHSLFT
jgi:hypothetical protein